MFDTKTVSLDWAGRKLTLETGRVARQADGAVFATWGETALLATVVFAKASRRSEWGLNQRSEATRCEWRLQRHELIFGGLYGFERNTHSRHNYS